MGTRVTDEELRRGIEALREMGFREPELWLEGAEALQARVRKVAPAPTPPAKVPTPPNESGAESRRPPRYTASVGTAEVTALKRLPEDDNEVRVELSLEDGSLGVEALHLRLKTRQIAGWTETTRVRIVCTEGRFYISAVEADGKEKCHETRRALA